MKLEINIDETQFKDVLDKELKDMPKEVLREIITEGLKNYFNNNGNIVEDMLVQKTNNWNDYHKVPTRFLEELLKSCDFSELQDFVDKMIELLKEKYTEILVTAITALLYDGLMNNYMFRDRLETEMRCFITRELDKDINVFNNYRR